MVVQKLNFAERLYVHVDLKPKGRVGRQVQWENAALDTCTSPMKMFYVAQGVIIVTRAKISHKPLNIDF